MNIIQYLGKIHGHFTRIQSNCCNIRNQTQYCCTRWYGEELCISTSKKDSQYVACGDNEERTTVRTNFLKKKLGLTNSDANLDASIDAACLTMKGDCFKSRLAMYYLLADKYDKLTMFIK